jgi:hypothetical protein
MSGFRAFRVLRIAAAVAAAIVVGGLLVMALWNWLVPSLIGWHRLNFIQALGLLVLCRVLFGGFRGRGHAWGYGRFRQMSEQERERFRQEMRSRCGQARELGPSA